ncbi:MAG TPA: PAS domain S-box protein [Dehalococcoidia bacterium]|nr:PAS domain S-box protein [Dehalococcoidia bacterium]
MNLRRKTRIIVGTMFLGLIVILYFLSENFLRTGDGAGSISVYEQDVAIAYLMLMIVGVGLVFGIVTILLLEKQVLSRLTYLSNGIQSIGISGDITTRVSMPGTDELSVLAGTINGLLAAMEQSEAELRESELHYRLLAENATDVIYMMDVNLNFTYVSPSVRRLTGHSVEEARSQSLDKILTRASLEHAMDAFAEEATRESEEEKDLSRSRTLELEVKRKDGSTVWVEAIMSALRDPEGRVISILGVARDITKRRSAEDKLQELYHKERALRQTLEAEIKKRIEFTRALVHELKTPVTPVMASSELLLQRLKDEPLYGLAQNINQGANNLNRRIDELLDLARGEIGMLRLNREPMEPKQLLEQIVYEETPVAMRSGQTLTAQLPESLPVVVADEERFRQVVFNLLNNATKFTPPGGKITLKARVERANLVVEVQDNGVGISPEDQKVLFEPYRSLERDRERLSGLGLGLSLSKTLVELHGGRIWVKSEKGKGSTFGFSLPLATTGHKEKVRTGNKS